MQKEKRIGTYGASQGITGGLHLLYSLACLFDDYGGGFHNIIKNSKKKDGRKRCEPQCLIKEQLTHGGISCISARRW